MMVYVLLIAGFILLIKGADYFVEGSASIAKNLKVPSMIIGLTIVAMGTSAPEASVSISAALKGSNEMALSNVIGSNIFNLMVVCGICALFKPLSVQVATLKKEFPFAVLAGVLLFVLAGDMFLFQGIFGGQANEISQVDGIIFLVIFVGFLAWMVQSALKARKNNAMEADDEIKALPMNRCVFYIILGLAAIVIGGDVVVDSASEIAARFGLSQTLIGLTIVAFGTSLPELVTSVVAAKKGEVDMALGNVIGSNIFNILLVLGLSAVLHPVTVVTNSFYDLIILTVMSIFVWIFAWSKRHINRVEGMAMIIAYAVYIVYICIR